jgi:hypothetical protein
MCLHIRVHKLEKIFKGGAAKYNNTKIYIYILIPKQISNGLNFFRGLTSKVSTFGIED